MHPRFVNPHLQPQHFSTVSRREIYGSTEKKGENGDLDNLEKLRDLIKEASPSLKHFLEGHAEAPKYKKAKLYAAEDVVEEPLPFRLVSSQRVPILLSLLQPPPPPPVTREPEPEDTETQAVARRRHAEAAALDGSTILQAANVPTVLTGNLTLARTSSQLPKQPFAILRSLQPTRKTRPPVPPDLLTQHPYATGPALDALQQGASFHASNVVDITPIKPPSARLSTTQRRRQKSKEAKKKSRTRPPPQFWRPNPEWLGKCQGYAYGYPSSLAVGIERWKYRPDAMRKAVWAETSGR